MNMNFIIFYHYCSVIPFGDSPLMFSINFHINNGLKTNEGIIKNILEVDINRKLADKLYLYLEMHALLLGY